MGAHLNAYTSREQTVYYAKNLTSDLGRGMYVPYVSLCVLKKICTEAPTHDIVACWCVAVQSFSLSLSQLWIYWQISFRIRLSARPR